MRVRRLRRRLCHWRRCEQRLCGADIAKEGSPLGSLREGGSAAEHLAAAEDGEGDERHEHEHEHERACGEEVQALAGCG